MRDHELELIAALVEGRLEDESEARALIASSPEHQEEYEAQKLAYQALRDAGSVSLSETERAALHRDVWTELRSGVAPARARTPWYYRWVPVAAGGLFLVVGLVAVLGQVGGGDDAASDETMRLADAPIEGTTSTAEASEELDEGDDGEAAPAGGQQSATTTAAESSGDADTGADTGGGAALYSAEAVKVRERDFSGANLQAYDDAARTDAIDGCLEQLGIADYQVVATYDGPTEDDTSTTIAGETGLLLVAVPKDAGTATAPVAFIDPDTCELVYLDQ